MTTPVYVDVHVLQTVPPSNLNRDDAGSPKQAIYGGVRRARVSSQAWKRATRLYFNAESADSSRSGVRTKRVPLLWQKRLEAVADLDADTAYEIAAVARKAIGVEKADKNHREFTSYLLFLGRDQIEAVADLLVASASDLRDATPAERTKLVEEMNIPDILGRGHPLDVALFGRMVADLATLNVDAACQVAHAVSTHSVETEFDYFTAVDDENPDDETGAGMIGTIEFNSATLYRFATLGVHLLAENLEGDLDAVAGGLRSFLRAFVLSMPTGHQNAFAHRTVPEAVVFVVRRSQPVNLVTAFEQPVRPTQASGAAAESLARLDRELDLAGARWGLTADLVASVHDGDPEGLTAIGQGYGFDEALEVIVHGAMDIITGNQSGE